MTRVRSRFEKLPKLLLAISLFFLCSCSQSILESEDETKIEDVKARELLKFRKPIAPFFKPMFVRKGDWLKTFKEDGQTFAEYINADPTLPTEKRNKIYIQPIGEFTEKQTIVLHNTAEYMRRFYNLPVQMNDVKPLGNVSEEYKRENKFGKHLQIKTDHFLEKVLPEMLPDDAAALICFTNYDLYPGEGWNFVFGQASLKKRVGAWSLWRFGDPEKSLEDYELFFRRTLKVGMHETGHMFTMKHCTKYECLMSGSIGLHESDRRPLDVCPECMLKIAWAMDYPPLERYEKLADFWKKMKWSKEKENFEQKAEAIRKVLK